jgi:hypothetical protein
MIKKIVSYQIHSFDEPINDDDAYQCAMECEGQDEFDHFVFEIPTDCGEFTCQEIENVIEKFNGYLELSECDKNTLRGIIIDKIFTTHYDD